MVKRNPFKTIIITGVPGVGKTTLINKLKEEAPGNNIKIMVANFGDYMLKTAVKLGIVKDRDGLRKLSHRTQLSLQREAAIEIINDAKKNLKEEDVLLVDTHSIVKTVAGYWPGLPEHVVKELNPDSIVLIEAEPEEILIRQQKDKSRDRKDLAEKGKDLIKEMMNMARIAAVASATLTASSVYIVRNPQDRIMEPVKELLSLFQRL